MAAWTVDDLTRRTAAGQHRESTVFTSAGRRMMRSGMEPQVWRQAPAAELWTFASPKVGTRGFANCFSRTHIPSYRLTFNTDPVSHLPPGIDHIMEFEHVPGEIYFPSPNKVIFCHESEHVRGTDAACSTSSAWKQALKKWSFVDHSKALWLDKNGPDGRGGTLDEDCGVMTPEKMAIVKQDDPDSKWR
jgi:hypothetical protein